MTILSVNGIIIINLCVTQKSRGNIKNMKEFFSISETAKIVNLTPETLRHYDRINLVKPGKVDKWTGYRYYSMQDIVVLNTIRALRCMDLTLAEIKEILSYDDFNKIVSTLKQAEKNADEKIAELIYAKNKIQRARVYYENKLTEEQAAPSPVKYLPKRTILLSDTMSAPSLENLWNYHKNFYRQLPESVRGDFSFEDLAGVYEKDGRRRLFAVCTRFTPTDGLMTLPQGRYLCADCTEENRESVIKNVLETAKTQYNITPEFILQLIVVSGILQWNYQVQVFISD